MNQSSSSIFIFICLPHINIANAFLKSTKRIIVFFVSIFSALIYSGEYQDGNHSGLVEGSYLFLMRFYLDAGSRFISVHCSEITFSFNTLLRFITLIRSRIISSKLHLLIISGGIPSFLSAIIFISSQLSLIFLLSSAMSNTF